ncbi:hypothetical protein ILP92_13035 [Maribius pontilimi]|uniref:Uncharacterized protein n=1 Tax=Palleronia pontilimi TaxID=1964209 RepID=A0A934IHW8_9RHOB|nr:hypothetical protein [Palleronia pontilimi]MBJ3763675.1 hypothetical protein [Palleronia pontilimi]
MTTETGEGRATFVIRIPLRQLAIRMSDGPGGHLRCLETNVSQTFRDFAELRRLIVESSAALQEARTRKEPRRDP